MTLLDRVRRFYPPEDTLPSRPGGKLNPCWHEGDTPRFALFVDEHDPGEEPGWRFKFYVYDYKYLDDDGAPINAVAHGDSWDEAFTCAGEFIHTALHCTTCAFY